MLLPKKNETMEWRCLDWECESFAWKETRVFVHDHVSFDNLIEVLDYEVVIVGSFCEWIHVTEQVCYLSHFVDTCEIASRNNVPSFHIKI